MCYQHLKRKTIKKNPETRKLEYSPCKTTKTGYEYYFRLLKLFLFTKCKVVIQIFNSLCNCLTVVIRINHSHSPFSLLCYADSAVLLVSKEQKRNWHNPHSLLFNLFIFYFVWVFART